MKQLLSCILALIALWLFAGASGSGVFRRMQPTTIQSIYVNNQSGSDSYDGLSPSPLGGAVGPKRTIASAISAASDGQTVSVASTGTDYDEMDTGAKSLRFTSTAGSPTIPNITIAAATAFDGPFTMASSGTLTLSVGVFAGAGNLTISSGGTIVRSDGSFLPGDSPIVTHYNLIYRTEGAVTSTSDEFVTSTTAVSSLAISGTGTLLTLHADRTIGSLILNSPGGGIVLGSSTGTTTLSLKGDATVSAGTVSSRTLTAAAAKSPTIAFIGTSPQTITVPSGGLTLQFGTDSNNDGDFLDAGDLPPVDIEINNRSSSNVDKTITLTGGNMTMGMGSTVWLKSGVVVTGSNVWTLAQGRVPATNQPTQGFFRSCPSGTFSHFVGNVCKYVNTTMGALAISEVTFPVGTLQSPRACYRPLSLNIKDAPSASFNVTVSHVDSRPSGMSGFPIVAGGITITDYANFYWYVRSDIPLAPSSRYCLEAQAQGYTGYVVDQVQDVRLIRRDPADISPEWKLMTGRDGILYENSTIAPDWPVVKSINCNGGITTQGSIITYSKSSRTAFLITGASSNLTSTSATLNGQTYAIDLTLTVWFEWGTSSTLSSYGTTTSQSPGIGYPTLVTANLTGLSPGTNYYYRLAGKDTGEMQRGSIVSFATAKPPAQSAPTLLSPADTARNVSLTPTLSWNSMAGATSYELQVSPFFSFATYVYDDTTSGLSRTIGPLNLASKYFWRVRATNADGIGPFSEVRGFQTILNVSVARTDGAVPTEYALTQNYPNPFNPTTNIQFAIPKTSYVTLKVFNALGKEVGPLVSQDLSPGYFTVKWNASTVPSGIYFYRLQVGDFIETKKMILLK